MIAIPNIERPKLCKDGEKICFAWDDEKYRCRITEWKKPCPLIDIVTCGECKHRPIKDDPDGADYGFNIVAPTDGDDLCPCLVEDGWYSWMPEDNFYCGRGERRSK